MEEREAHNLEVEGSTPSPAPTQAEWDGAWFKIYNSYLLNSSTREKAFELAHKEMQRRYGPRPEGPPSLKSLALRIFWLVKVKNMDWKKLLYGGLAAFGGAAFIALGAAVEGGINQQELWLALGAGLAALGLYLKDPNAHRGPDVRQKNGNPFTK